MFDNFMKDINMNEYISDNKMNNKMLQKYLGIRS